MLTLTEYLFLEKDVTGVESEGGVTFESRQIQSN
jgi:hypothetical protein